ncbi:hypothetical protein Poly21_52020 [Allorhodopirellula heiligendammensis]|uniref:Uncharacterized protein n=1 Tax=Allorhodopirellula heiligendammensis TaxID=2714739 RepID=A0A5C6BES5_9BACT|nr:hypothetical protein Poly21_52020 [Allorhodopirellula heiligendammensis]
MGHNGLTTISEPVSTNSTSPMDPLNRVPPYNRALPDSDRRGDGDNAAGSEGDGNRIDTQQDVAASGVSVDELIREFELDLGGDSLQDDSIDSPPQREQSGTLGANEGDFATIGVRNLEWRLPIIRSAAHRSADAIASSQLVEPSESNEQQLTRIVLSTYRLIDPRFRGSYFQQVRVGRMLPIVLQSASCIDGTPPSLQPSSQDDQQHGLRLFGHMIPQPATDPPGVAPPTARRPFRHPVKQQASDQRRLPKIHANYRTEAIEVLAELQFRSRSTRWTRWFQGPRLIVSLAAASILLIAATIGYRMSLPQSAEDLAVTQSTQKLSARKSQPLIQEALTSPLPLAQPAPPPAVASPPPEVALPTSNSELTAPETIPTRPPAPLPAVPDTAMHTPTRDQAEPHELTTAELMAALARATEMPDIGLPAPDIPTRPVPQLPDDTPPSINPQPANIPPSSNGSSNPAPPPAEAPDVIRDAPLPPPSSAAITTATLDLWSETDAAGRRFTAVTADELIDSWALIADISRSGSAENMAAQRLIGQASWLIHPLATIVAQLRATEFSTSVRVVGASAQELENTANLDEDETELLLDSWRAARKRVVRTSDLDQMLRQANVLLDRILISNRLSPHDRSNLLAAFRVDVEQLVKISSDQEAISETDSLWRAIDTLPNSNEWERLAAAKPPSGLMASIYCLQQRRWDEGLAWLGQASNPAIAAAAKAEWKLIQSGTLHNPEGVTLEEARANLASRWSKIADRLEPREAAAVRLHAIMLCGDAPHMESEREAMRAELPAYLD